MKYEMVDPIIEDWGRQNLIHWVRLDRDYEVRSADIYMPTGTSAQLWLEPQSSDGVFAVQAWDRKSRHFREVASLQELHTALDRALSAIRSWHLPSPAV